MERRLRGLAHTQNIQNRRRAQTEVVSRGVEAQNEVPWKHRVCMRKFRHCLGLLLTSAKQKVLYRMINRWQSAGAQVRLLARMLGVFAAATTCRAFAALHAGCMNHQLQVLTLATLGETMRTVRVGAAIASWRANMWARMIDEEIHSANVQGLCRLMVDGKVAAHRRSVILVMVANAKRERAQVAALRFGLMVLYAATMREVVSAFIRNRRRSSLDTLVEVAADKVLTLRNKELWRRAVDKLMANWRKAMARRKSIAAMFWLSRKLIVHRDRKMVRRMFGQVTDNWRRAISQRKAVAGMMWLTKLWYTVLVADIVSRLQERHREHLEQIRQRQLCIAQVPRRILISHSQLEP
jgi:hypothetical protein